MYPKKAQAAIEFLTTYGWMFLIVIVVIGGLGYLGVFQPANFITDSCTFSTSMACGPFQIYESTSNANIVFDIELVNNLPQDVRIDAIEIRARDSDSFCRSFRIRDPASGLVISTDAELNLRARGSKEYRFLIRDGNANCAVVDAGLDIIGKQSYVVRLEYVLAKETTQLPQIVPGTVVTEIGRN